MKLATDRDKNGDSPDEKYRFSHAKIKGKTNNAKTTYIITNIAADISLLLASLTTCKEEVVEEGGAKSELGTDLFPKVVVHVRDRRAYWIV